ncbi:MAG: hypothetical protein QW177_06730 [Candidatus Nitrosotenuis sp.]
MFAAKSIKQNFTPNPEQLQMMDTFKDMVNHCIRIGLENNCSTMKKLSMLSYHQLENYPILSYYKLTAISQAAGRLAQMKKDIKRGRKSHFAFCQKAVPCFLLWVQDQWHVAVIFDIRQKLCKHSAQQTHRKDPFE